MLLHVPALLTREELASMRARLAAADWGEGRATAGRQSAEVKRNLQLPEESAVARELGERILAMLSRNALFLSAALPARVYPPLFNKYEAGMSFGAHIDNAIRPVPGTPHRIRTDVSATLFLSEPEDYEGGALVIEESGGPQRIKPAAGDLVLYPATSRHHVETVTRGTRLAAFFWIQSMVKDAGERALLFDLDRAVIELGAANGPNDPAMLRLTGLYHNLVRKWGEP